MDTGYPWYDDDLMEMRARQRRWLSGLPTPENWPPPTDIGLTGIGAVLAERAWREAFDAIVVDERLEQLNQLAAAVQADQLVTL